MSRTILAGNERDLSTEVIPILDDVVNQKHIDLDQGRWGKEDSKSGIKDIALYSTC